jgi:hypothetical protein
VDLHGNGSDRRAVQRAGRDRIIGVANTDLQGAWATMLPAGRYAQLRAGFHGDPEHPATVSPSISTVRA